MLVFTHCDLDGEALERQVLAAHLNSLPNFWPHVIMADREENAFNPMKDPSAPPSLRHWLERIGALAETWLQ